ncbi:unnamed protein product [Adineta steineri]|uniref:Peptidase M13 N-terminal domain-containing protein n=1 Tax=Adineta steineri TaxID=433720 RepID=A0A813UU31_9BILA|nr:unnamed protein product [Adineta steineri]
MAAHFSEGTLKSISTDSAMSQTRSMRPFIVLGILVGIFALSTAVLAVILAMNNKTTADNELCVTPYCVKAANYLIESLDESAQPCEDFYQFVCGTWIKNNRIPDDSNVANTFNLLRTQLDYNVVDILTPSSTNDTNEPNAIINARNLYHSCINEQHIEDEGINPILSLINNEFGGWPIIQSLWDNSTFDILDLLLKLRKYNNNILFGIGTSVDDRNSTEYDLRRGIATPPFNFFFGHLKTVWNHPSHHRQLENWTKQYGKIYGIYEGTHPILVVSDPDFLQEVFIKQFSVFHTRLITMLDDVSSNLGFSTGSKWRRQRHVINPSFTAVKLKAMSPLINGSINDLMDKLLEHSNIGDEFNLYLYYKRVTMDVICRCAFGVDIDLQNNPNHIYFQKVEELIGVHTILKSPIYKMTQLVPETRSILARLYLAHNTARKYINTRVLPLISLTKQLDESAFAWLLNRLHTIVEQRQKTPISRKDLLQLMLQAMNKEPNQNTAEDDNKTNHWLSKDEVIGNTVAFMVAGYETTSTALAYATYVLAKHPDVLKKLQDEIDQLPIDNDDNTNDEKIKEYPNYDTVTHLSYMDMFISEVLRMYPIGNFTLQRCAMENTVVQGINIEKGTTVYADIYSIHYDRELWGPDDPYIFLPERHKTKRHPMAFMAFGAGPRNCVGMRFALIEIKMLLTRLLQEYTILPGEHLESNFNIHEEIAIVPEAIWIKLLKRET